MTQFVVMRCLDGGLQAIPVSSICLLEVREGLSDFKLGLYTTDAWYVAWPEMDREAVERGLRELVEVLSAGASVDITEPGCVRRIG